MIISIEGNIGSGKSTFVKHLQKYTDTTVHLPHHAETYNAITFIQEPVDEWNSIKDSNGESILEKFYKNQEEYSFSFQIMAYITRLRKIIDAIEQNPNGIFICERSLETDKYVFAQMLYDDHKIREIDWIIYNYWFDTFITKINTNKIVYIQTSPDNCYNRIKQRNRLGEDSIPLEYLQNCHKYHEQWLENTNTNVTTINGNIDIQDTYTYTSILQTTLQEIINDYTAKRYNNNKLSI